MSTKKITYEKKAPFQTDENIPEINQVTSDNLNEIKDVVNINADELESKQPKEQGKGLSTNDFTNEFKNKLENLNNYDDKEITSKVTNLEENVVNIQKEQTTQNKDIEDLKTDNKKNKTDLQAIKQEQQDQNSKIENNTVENKDNTELLNQIMGLLPSAKGEGEHVTLQDTGEARFKNFQVQGNSKQETRSGKNKIPYPYKDLSGTVIQDLGDGRLILNGTLAENTYKIIQTFELKTGKYKLLFSKTNIPNGSYVLMSGKVSGQILQGNKVDASFELTEDDTVTLGFSILKGTYNQFPLNLMLLEETEQDETFEPYGLSPSSEFLSKIRNVGDNVNLFNGNFSQGYDSNGTIKTSNNFVCNTDLISVKSGKKYTISNNLNKNIVSISYYNDNKFVKFESNLNLKTIKIPNDVNQIRFNLYDSTKLLVSDISLLKIEEGTQATAYSPYNCGNVDITVSNKNWLNTQNSSKSSLGLIWNISKEEIKITGTATSTYSQSAQQICEIPVGTYKFEYETNNTNLVYGIWLFNSENQIIATIRGKNSTTINEKVVKYAIFIENTIVNTAYDITLKAILLNIKTEDKTFVPHQQQTILFPFTEGQRLYKGDYLAEDGIHHTRKQIVLDGTEVWQLGGTGNNTTNQRFYIYKDFIKANGDIACNYLKQVYKGSIDIFNNDVEGCNVSNGQYIQIKINKKIASTVDKLNDWIKQKKNEGNPLTFECELDKEEVDSYTPEQQEAYNQLKKLYSYNEQTNIFSTDEISPVFNVEAIKNLNATFAQLSATMLERS